MSNKKTSGFGIRGKGLYIALVLCAAAIGIMSYVTNHRETPETQNPQSVEAAATETPLPEDVQPVAAEPTAENVQAPAEPTQPEMLKTTAPLAGKEVFGYSMEALSYNQTTRDWRTHNGVDIAAEEGTEVMAAADGQVYTTYEDETLGYTVVIRHEGGYTTHYSSLADEVAVKAGDKVKLGQTIGTVGNTALMESALPDHVCFRVTLDGETIDPAEFLD